LKYSQSIVKERSFDKVKKIVKHITACFLLIVFFISTSGFTIYSHVCDMGGTMDKADVKKVSSCCAETNYVQTAESKTIDHPANISDKCCKTNASFIKLNFSAHQQKHVQLDHIQFIALIGFHFSPEQFTQYYSYNNSDQNLPPPKTGRDILLQQDLLRI
jgi:hypothetical protein